VEVEVEVAEEVAEAEAEVEVAEEASEVEVEVAEEVAEAEVEAEVEVEAAEEAAEAEGCIGGGGMHWKHRNASEEHGADGTDRDGGEYTVLEAVKTVRTCQNLSEQNGTRLGLLLLHVGPNGDGFGGQAFMEHYTVHALPIPPLTSPHCRDPCSNAHPFVRTSS
jgi:hypothetical protein